MPLNGSFLISSTSGQGDAGLIKITTTDSIKFDGTFAASRANGAVGNAGGVDVSTKTLELLNGSSLISSTSGQGDAGLVKITVSDSVKFDSNSAAASQAIGAVGNTGGVDISTKTLELLNGSLLISSTYGQGDAGTVKITATDSVKFDGNNYAASEVAIGNSGGVDISAKTLELLNGSVLISNLFGKGNAGLIKITATDSIKFDGNSYAASQVIAGAIGNSGGVDISAKTLELLNGSFLISNTFGQGDAGTVKITATDSVKFDGNTYAFSGVITGAVGNAGGVDISTKTLELLGGSFLSASTLGQGNAGIVKINATDSIKFDGNSSAASQVRTGAVGNAGGVDISTKTLELLGSSFLSADTYGRGDAGTVKITATDSVKFDGNSSAASQVRTGAVGNAGGVDISAKTLEILNGSGLAANTAGTGNAGQVKITATDSIKFDGSSYVFSQVRIGILGNSGGVNISSKTLELLGSSYLSVSTFGRGDAGTVKITATDSIKFDGNSYVVSEVIEGAVGNAGSVNISAKTLELLGSSSISTTTGGTGNAGSVKINATDSIKFDGNSYAVSQVIAGAVGNAGGVDISSKTLEILGASFLSANTLGRGNAGVVKIIATDSVKFDGNSSAGSQVETGAVGNAGGVNIFAKTLEILGGSFLSANTGGTGDAGQVKITANDSIKFDGNSYAFTGVTIGAVGNAGGVDISTKNLELLGGAFLSASTAGKGDAGQIKITATDSIKLANGAKIATATLSSGTSGKIEIIAGNSFILDGENTGLFASTTENSTGNGGSISIDPPLVSITNGASISVNSLGKGNGGNIDIFAGKLIFSNNALIIANTASGEGGNINLQIADIFFPRNSSNITATAGGTGNGGNINLSSLFVLSIPSENNDIFANAFFGKGGNISINTQSLFGIESRPKQTLLSDITASSEFGLQGTVSINTPGVDPSKGLNNLPTDTRDASKLVSERCLADRYDSSFVITGRGGIPASPFDIISSANIRDRLVSISNQTASNTSNLVTSTSANSSDPSSNQILDRFPDRIVEAQGWIINSQGQIFLVAEDAVKPVWSNQSKCK
jgi:large exoprotein involved in heme utilization and adhesion